MFDAYKLLARLRDHFGYECSVTIGIYKTIIAISVTWNENEFTATYGLSEETVQSAVSSEMLEKMAIQHIENEHKMWEVGEI